jgi:hypothetical protein
MSPFFGNFVVTLKEVPTGVQLFPTWLERASEQAPPSAVPEVSSKQQCPLPVEHLSPAVLPSLNVAFTLWLVFWLTRTSVI